MADLIINFLFNKFPEASAKLLYWLIESPNETLKRLLALIAVMLLVVFFIKSVFD